MEAFFTALRTLTPLTAALRLLLALAFGGLIGLERERRDRPAGLRTYMVVCIGAALSTLIGQFAVQVQHFDTDPLRIGAQVISGIGFLGAGTILVRGRFHVTGLTTAAGLWTTAIIGLALGIGFYEGALFCTLGALAVIRLLHTAERRFSSMHRQVALYAELRSADHVQAFLTALSAYGSITNLQVTPPKSATPGHVGVEGVFPIQSSHTEQQLLDELGARPEVAFALRSM